MSNFFAGLTVLFSSLVPILVFFFSTLGAGIWLVHSFTAGRQHSLNLTFSLAAAVGIIPIALLNYLVISLGRVWESAPHIGSWIIFGLSIACLIWWCITNRSDLHPRLALPSLGIFALTFLGLLILRLAFLKDLLAPPYSDSPYHYLIVQDFLTPFGRTDWHITGLFYHTAFHSLTAWLCTLTGIPALQGIPLVGQLLLTLLPLSVYGLMLALSGKRSTAWVSALLAAFAWGMPAFATNWGKYPALSAVLLFPAVIALAGMRFQAVLKPRGTLLILFLLTAGAGLFHSRILVLIVLVLVTALVYRSLVQVTSNKTLIGFAFLVFMITLVLYLNTPDLQTAYNGRFHIPIAIVLCLLPFALTHFPRETTAAGIFILLLFVGLQIPLPRILLLPAETLIDRQYLMMMFYLPLAAVAGLGYSAAKIHFTDQRIIKGLITALVVVMTLFGAVTADVYTPSVCCNYLTRDDLAAMDWIRNNLPGNAVIFIPGFENGDGLVGSDAGIWVQPLTDRQTSLLSFDHVWFSYVVHEQDCLSSRAYLYESAGPYGFQIDNITHPDWYHPVFTVGNITIYQIIGCPDH